MTTKYYAILTHVGAAKLANAAALGSKLQITQMAVGDGGGTLPSPTATQTSLIGEKRRAALNSLSVDAVNGSQIIAEQIIPEGEGGFWIREIGLFDADDALIAVANCAETYKPQLQEGSGRTQTVRMILIVNSADAVTLKIDPSVVLATRKYVDDKVIEVKSSLLTELSGKMDKAKNGADIQNVADFLKNLGLGEDAKLSGNLTVKGGVWDTAPGTTPQRVWSPNNKPTLNEIGVVDATTAAKGIVKLATNAEMAAGTSATLTPSVAAIMSIFSKRSLSENDYIRIPDVPGGLIFQWVRGTASANGILFAQLPVPFPNKLLFAGAVEAGANVWGANSISAWGVDLENSSLTQIIAYARRVYTSSILPEAAKGLVIAIGN
ncbi:phage tail protein [Erwinia sp. Eh17-17]|uniref:phage tail protein n=1 Tax=Erwinia sp. Eh17-17 TaxID=3080330 RepID=UPI00320A31E4